MTNLPLAWAYLADSAPWLAVGPLRLVCEFLIWSQYSAWCEQCRAWTWLEVHRESVDPTSTTSRSPAKVKSLGYSPHSVVTNRYSLKSVFFFEYFSRMVPGERPRLWATEVSSCLAVTPGLGAIVVDPPSLQITHQNYSKLKKSNLKWMWQIEPIWPLSSASKLLLLWLELRVEAEPFFESFLLRRIDFRPIEAAWAENNFWNDKFNTNRQILE